MLFKVTLSVAAIIFATYLILIAPRLRSRTDKKLLSTKYAHRGLHSKESGVPENSMRAFELAVENGYGIELDVRFSSDKELVVFHDETLKRVCGIDEKVCNKTLAELSQINLLGTEQKIPSFKEVLALVDGKVPLLVEIKQDAGEANVASAVCDMLADYKGDLLIESFNPLALVTVKKRLPSVFRGLLCDRFTEQKKYKKPLYYVLQAFLLNFLCKPDFIAYNHSAKSGVSYFIIKNIFKTPFVAWTARSKDEQEKAERSGYLTVIFENYRA